MKRLLVAVILAVLIAVPTLAAAKSVVYVTHQACTGRDCSCLAGEDLLFCTNLTKIGYKVMIDTEGDVKDNSATWKTDYAKADLIFLGDVSDAVVLTTQSQPSFCNNVKASGKKVFATFGNAYVNRTTNRVGCAFSIPLVVYPKDDNICSDTSIKVTESNYITKGFDLDSLINVYTDAKPMKVNLGEATASVHCEHLYQEQTGFYSVIKTSDAGTFWGLDTPSVFTSDAWLLFKRAVLYTTGDDEWNVSFFTIPNTVSNGKSFMLIANVSNLAGPVKEGQVNAVFGNAVIGTLTYNNETGYWENRDLSISSDGLLNITAEEGSAQQAMQAGTLEPKLVSGPYIPGRTYSAKANIFNKGLPATADVKYKVWDSNIKLLGEGSMKNIGGTYYADMSFSDVGNLIFEVTARNDTLSGGYFKILRPQNATFGYSVSPSDWVITATKPGSDTMTFTITPDNDVTGLTVDKAGMLANQMSFDTTGMKSDIPAGNSTSFTAKLDWSGLGEGQRTSELLIDSDQFSTAVPITFAYYKLTGDWLEAEPKVAHLAAPKGKNAVQTITLKNTANLPTSDIKVTGSNGLAGAVAFTSVPYYINASSQATAELTFYTTGKKEGTYSGTVTITSSLGTADIATDLTVTPDLSGLISTAQDDWQNEIARLTEGGAQLSSSAQQESDQLNATLTAAQTALAAEDYATANSDYQEALTSLSALKMEQKSSGTNWLVIILVLMVLGAAGYFGWNFYKKKKETAPEKEAPKAEDQYRTEYY